jgi:PAS domain S-box-containing protein
MIIDQYGAHWVEPAFKLGVTDILTRPIHPLVLRQRIRLILQARQTELAVARYQATEQALRTEEERFRTVADFTYDWEYWSAPDGSLLYNSPSCERITEYPPQAFMNNASLLSQIVIPDDRELFLNHLENEITTEQTYALDFRILTKTGNTRWIGHVCQQVHAKDGRVLGRRISNRDITQRKLVEHTLVRSKRLAAIGRLAASLSHEINNPLQTIYSSIELLQKFSLGEAERQQYLQIMRDEIERLMKINSGILDFSRDSAVHFQQTSIQPIIKRAIFLSGTNIKQANIRLEQNLPASLPQILASPDELTQVFLNIIINATEHMPGGGILYISACERDRKIEISFEDTGSGIPPDEIDLIFDPFYSTKKGGSGLGLAISQRIIQRHYGDISVRSLKDSGAVFTVTLPIQHLSDQTRSEPAHDSI